MRCSKPHSSGTPSKRTLAIALLVPLIALVAGTFATGSKPPLAVASNPLEINTTIDLRPIRLPKADEQTLSRTAWLLEQRSLPNPLYYPPRVEIQPIPDKPREPEVKIDPTQPAPFVVTAVLRGRDGSNRAVIDGTLFNEGDEIAPNWVISKIDSTERRVSVRRPDGSNLTLSLQNPDR